jgi:hypothetical protein
MSPCWAHAHAERPQLFPACGADDDLIVVSHVLSGRLPRASAQGPDQRSQQMPRYLISFDAHAMDHIPDEDMPAVARAAHEVVSEAMNAGVWVFGGGLENQKASIVATDGTVTDGPYPEAIGGFCVVDVPSREEALQWAAKNAGACRCAQEVREFMPDPAVEN